MARKSRAIALILLTAAAAGPARAQIFESIDHAEEYRACMLLSRQAPEEAFESAGVWEAQGGGHAAQHCAAVALLNLEQYARAATRFQTLAEAMQDRPAALRAEVLAQAGQAWILADETRRAHAAQSAALVLASDNVELWIDRALTLALAENYWEAIDDLNEAEGLAPKRADILIFRASAYRYVDALELAAEDIRRGLALDPDNVEGLLESGIIKRLSGDPEGARADWLKVVTLAGATPAADAARENLAQLDVKEE